MASLLLCEDILYRIRPYLAYVDRCELSLTCKNLYEPRKDLLRMYLRACMRPKQNNCVSGILLTWFMTSYTLDCNSVSVPPMGMELFLCDAEYTILRYSLAGLTMLKYLEAVHTTDLECVAYNCDTKRLHVKNWNALLRRRAIVVPNIALHLLGYDPDMKEDWLNMALDKMRDKIEFCARIGFTLVPYDDPVRVSDHFCEIFMMCQPYGRPTRKRLVQCGYSLKQFLTEM